MKPEFYLLNKGGHAPPFASRSEFARLILCGRAPCALRSAFTLPRLIEMILFIRVKILSWWLIFVPFGARAPLRLAK